MTSAKLSEGYDSERVIFETMPTVFSIRNVTGEASLIFRNAFGHNIPCICSLCHSFTFIFLPDPFFVLLLYKHWFLFVELSCCVRYVCCASLSFMFTAANFRVTNSFNVRVSAGLYRHTWILSKFRPGNLYSEKQKDKETHTRMVQAPHSAS